MSSVKTAISVTPELFEQAEALAKEMKVSRSRLFGLALEEFIRRRENQRLLEDLTAAYAEGPDEEEIAMRRAGRRFRIRQSARDPWTE